MSGESYPSESPEIPTSRPADSTHKARKSDGRKADADRNPVHSKQSDPAPHETDMLADPATTLSPFPTDQTSSPAWHYQHHPPPPHAYYYPPSPYGYTGVPPYPGGPPPPYGPSYPPPFFPTAPGAYYPPPPGYAPPGSPSPSRSDGHMNEHGHASSPGRGEAGGYGMPYPPPPYDPYQPPPYGSAYPIGAPPLSPRHPVYSNGLPPHSPDANGVSSKHPHSSTNPPPLEDLDTASDSGKTSAVEPAVSANELRKLKTYIRPPAPSNPEVVARRQHKNSQSRRRAAVLRDRVAAVAAMDATKRTEEDQHMLHLHETRRERKNNRSRERALERKEEMDRILGKKIRQRTRLEVQFLNNTMSKKQRKNEGDRLRRARLKALGLDARNGAAKKPGVPARGPLPPHLLDPQRQHLPLDPQQQHHHHNRPPPSPRFMPPALAYHQHASPQPQPYYTHRFTIPAQHPSVGAPWHPTAPTTYAHQEFAKHVEGNSVAKSEAVVDANTVTPASPNEVDGVSV